MNYVVRHHNQPKRPNLNRDYLVRYLENSSLIASKRNQVVHYLVTPDKKEKEPKRINQKPKKNPQKEYERYVVHYVVPFLSKQQGSQEKREQNQNKLRPAFFLTLSKKRLVPN